MPSSRAVGRLPIVDPDDPGTPPEVAQALNAFVMEPWSGAHNILKTMASNPKLFGAFAAFIGALYGEEQELAADERECAYLTASTVNECFY